MPSTIEWRISSISLKMKHGSSVEVEIDGIASVAGILNMNIHVEPTWHEGNHWATFSVREGGTVPWSSLDLKIKVISEDPITPAQEEQYEALKRPLHRGDVIILIHTGTNSVVLEMKL